MGEIEKHPDQTDLEDYIYSRAGIARPRQGEARQPSFGSAKVSTQPSVKDGPYAALYRVLMEAYQQSAEGKGAERHSNGKPFQQQPIMAIAKDVGLGFPTGQAIKKTVEATGMAGRGSIGAAQRELLGAIVYLAAAYLLLEEGMAKQD